MCCRTVTVSQIVTLITVATVLSFGRAVGDGCLITTALRRDLDTVESGVARAWVARVVLATEGAEFTTAEAVGWLNPRGFRRR